MDNITFQQIEAFLTIARYNNLSKAAANMFVSQPAISRTLNRLEASVGLTLFSRTNKGVALTPEGEYLFSALESAYNNVEAAVKVAHGLASSPQKSLRLVLPISYDAVDDYDSFKLVVRRYREAHPDVLVTEVLCDFAELRQQLEFGDADLIISQSFAILGIPNISHLDLGPYTMHIAISEEHPLAQGDVITPDMLRGEVLYIVPQTGTSFDKENAVLLYRQMGFTPKSIEFVPNFLTLVHTIRLKTGYSICGKFSSLGLSGIKYYPVAQARDVANIIVAWRNRRMSRETRDFVDMLRSSNEQG
ncbi:MAG: LysR family transcriptional regulator [Oscillospiraceae bacterium]|jgi:DNA-binding transcriptional LysR family regulator|nr:LysR family transcriptional regulator [Oscillospiraceae bacterium]